MSQSIGIDPGLTGAISLFDSQGELVDVWDMPAIQAPRGKGNIVSPQLLADIFQNDLNASNAIETAYIEQVSAMPGQGVSSMFKFGRCAGLIEGVVAAFGISIEYVTPQKWKKHFSLIGKDKDAARQLCLERYPHNARLFKRKKDIGRADAVLIGQYGIFR